MNELVIDASAMLALARGEAGFETVDRHREAGIASSVNLMEAFSRLVRYAVDPERVQSFLRQAFPNVVPFDREQAETAALIHAKTRDLGLSLGDCACLALAASRGIGTLTADRAWTNLPFDIPVVLIR